MKGFHLLHQTSSFPRFILARRDVGVAGSNPVCATSPLKVADFHRVLVIDTQLPGPGGILLEPSTRTTSVDQSPSAHRGTSQCAPPLPCSNPMYAVQSVSRSPQVLPRILQCLTSIFL